jgi:hypothetical protein
MKIDKQNIFKTAYAIKNATCLNFAKSLKLVWAVYNGTKQTDTEKNSIDNILRSGFCIVVFIKTDGIKTIRLGSLKGLQKSTEIALTNNTPQTQPLTPILDSYLPNEAFIFKGYPKQNITTRTYWDFNANSWRQLKRENLVAIKVITKGDVNA